HAYSTSHDRGSRAEESYRLFAGAQNIASEKEEQRAALLDWENEMMFDVATHLTADQLPRLGASEFGLWFRHKGAHGFEGAAETGLILDSMARIDDVRLQMFSLRRADAPERGILPLLRELRENTRG